MTNCILSRLFRLLPVISLLLFTLYPVRGQERDPNVGPPGATDDDPRVAQDMEEEGDPDEGNDAGEEADGQSDSTDRNGESDEADEDGPARKDDETSVSDGSDPKMQLSVNLDFYQPSTSAQYYGLTFHVHGPSDGLSDALPPSPQQESGRQDIFQASSGIVDRRPPTLEDADDGIYIFIVFPTSAFSEEGLLIRSLNPDNFGMYALEEFFLLQMPLSNLQRNFTFSFAGKGDKPRGVWLTSKGVSGFAGVTVTGFPEDWEESNGIPESYRAMVRETPEKFDGILMNPDIFSPEVVGGIAGGVLLLLIIIIATVLVYRRRAKHRDTTDRRRYNSRTYDDEVPEHLQQSYLTPDPRANGRLSLIGKPHHVQGPYTESFGRALGQVEPA